MAYGILGVYLFLLAASVLAYRKWSNPILFFNLIWCVWLFLSAVGSESIVAPRNEILGYFLLGGIVLNVAGFLFTLLDQAIFDRRPARIPKVGCANLIRMRLLTFAQVVIFIYHIYKAVSILDILTSGGSYERIRGYYYSDAYFRTTIEYLAVTYVFDPIVMLGEAVFAVNLFHRRCSRLALGLMAANAVVRAVISGGRMIIFEFAALIVVCYLYRRKTQARQSKKNKWKVFLLLAMVFLLAALITSGRRGSEGGLIRSAVATLVSNFTGSFSYFSILDQFDMYLPMQGGKAMFGGIVDLVLLLPNVLGLTNIPYISNEIGTITSEFFSIGDISYNAMPTMYYFFMTDFGKAGIVIGCTILAGFCIFLYRRCNRLQTYRALVLYLLMMLVVIESSMTWLPFRASFIMTLLYAVFFVDNQPLRDLAAPNTDWEK